MRIQKTKKVHPCYLMNATSWGYVEIVRLLLGIGANTETRDAKGAAASQMAVDGKYEAVV